MVLPTLVLLNEFLMSLYCTSLLDYLVTCRRAIACRLKVEEEKRIRAEAEKKRRKGSRDSLVSLLESEEGRGSGKESASGGTGGCGSSKRVSFKEHTGVDGGIDGNDVDAVDVEADVDEEDEDMDALPSVPLPFTDEDRDEMLAVLTEVEEDVFTEEVLKRYETEVRRKQSFDITAYMQSVSE